MGVEDDGITIRKEDNAELYRDERGKEMRSERIVGNFYHESEEVENRRRMLLATIFDVTTWPKKVARAPK